MLEPLNYYTLLSDPYRLKCAQRICAVYCVDNNDALHPARNRPKLV